MSLQDQYDDAEKTGGVGWTVIAGNIVLWLAWIILALMFTLYPLAKWLDWIE